MRMKFKILFLCLISVCLFSCENANEKKLKREIEVANQQCPMNMGMLGDMISMKYDEKDKEVQMYLVVNDDFFNIDVLRNNENMARQSMKLSFSKGESREMLKEVIDAGASISITYKSGSTGKTFKMAQSLDDLKEIYDNPISDSEISTLMLANTIAMEDSRCPYIIDEGMEMTSVRDDGENIIYSCRLDEDIYDMSYFKYAYNDVKEGVSSVFDDPVVKRELSLIVSQGKNLIYRYSGDRSGEYVDITFAPYELNKFINKY